MSSNTPIFFCNHKRSKYFTYKDRAVFSNWYLSEFDDEDGIHYYTNEQYMMYKKAKLFGDDATAQTILAVPNGDPKTCKELGRQVRGFDPNIWSEHAKKIVTQGILYKFGQNKDLKAILLATGERKLVEAASYDKIWGIGLNEQDAMKTPETEWPGTNWLGQCLMDGRQQLRAK